MHGVRGSVVGALCVAAVVTSLSSGCATAPDRYRYGVSYKNPRDRQFPPGEEQIEIGRPNALLDATDWVWPNSLFGKLILWNSKVDSHQISPETVDFARQYLAKNELTSVKVRFNQYAPLKEFKRLVRNRATGWPWRYTFGLAGWFYYTILPGRITGGDHYNPYSNTVNVYSDIPAVALHECGHSKDFAGRKWRGTYNAMYGFVPLFKLYPEALASRDAISYLRAEGMAQQEKAAYKTLYPAYSTYLAGETAVFIPMGPVLSTIYMPANVIAAHVLGRMKAATVRVPQGADASPSPEETDPVLTME